jgi:hypothetical protein
VRGDGPEEESLSQAERMVEGRSGGWVSKWMEEEELKWEDLDVW